MRFSIHAGHGKQDSKSPGAYTSLLKESVANRDVTAEIIRLLREEGHTVYDDTVDYPSSASDCVNKQVANVNSHSNIDLAIGVHFNSGRNDLKGNGDIGGFECIVHNSNGTKQAFSKRICSKMQGLGFKNRGIKINTKLGFLKVNPQAIIIEICFVDDKDDVELYNKLGAKQIAKAVVEGILDKTITTTETKPTEPTTKETYYRVVIGSFTDKAQANKLKDKATELGFTNAFLTTFEK